jgi:endoglucanase
MMQLEGRGGYWWKAHDENGSVIGPDDSTPVPEGVNSSLAIYVKGQTSSDEGAWGVNFGANFSEQSGETYDASKYAGIAFKARVSEDSTKSVRFKLADVNTHKDPGVCTDCWNHFGKDLDLTTDWKEHVVLFEDLRQAAGWGDPRPPSVVPSKLYGVDFSIGKSAVFEIWVDDVTFLECAE